jgi:hypothetical protein
MTKKQKPIYLPCFNTKDTGVREEKQNVAWDKNKYWMLRQRYGEI